MSETFERAFAGRLILVTGGAGFVGGAVVRRLVEAGATVTVLDDLFTGRAETLPADVQLRRGLGRPTRRWSRDLVGEADLVFHMAARNIIASTQEPARRLRDQHRRHAQRAAWPPARRAPDRVVYTGVHLGLRQPADASRSTRTTPIVPLSPYAVSKLGGEHYCLAFYESYGLPISVVRYSNVYGEGQRPDNPYCGVVTKFFAAAYAGRTLSIHGDGQQTRDFTYVDDAVDATLLAGDRAARRGRGVQRRHRHRDLDQRAGDAGRRGGRARRSTSSTSTAATSTTSAAAS